MTRSILLGLLSLVSVGALGAVPIACQSGGVGDPCTPEAEYDPTFGGFKVAQEFIESRSFQCATRICLVNHFQGRVSCPYGQTDSVKNCNGPGDTSCGEGIECKEANSLAPDCTCKKGDTQGCSAACGGIQGLTCNPDLSICTCTGDVTDPASGTTYYCSLADPSCKSVNCTRILKAYVCHKPGNCQNSDLKDGANFGKECCIPGTETPVTVPVCGQCDDASKRNADNSVYCSCRCCPKCCDDPNLAKGEPCVSDKNLCGTGCDPNFHYCSCPTGFACAEIRKNVGLGDPLLTGAYCVKDGTEFDSSPKCGTVAGVVGQGCQGAAGSHSSN